MRRAIALALCAALGCETQPETDSVGRTASGLGDDDPLASIARLVVPVVGGVAEYAQGDPVPLVFAGGQPVNDLNVLALPAYGERLGLTALPEGRITQLRLQPNPALGPYVVRQDGAVQPVSVPSGGESGLKIVGPFEVGPTGGLTLTLDDDKSVWVHATGSAETQWVLRPVVQACVAVGVERSDYFIPYRTANMPNPALDNRDALLDAHRVKPVFARAECSPARALILVHGKSITASAVFDLQFKSYSWMEFLARHGIDTFAIDHLGFGLSRFATDAGFPDPLDQACNASLPGCACTAVPGVCRCDFLGPLPRCPCTAQPGVCDCPGPGNQLMDQQGSTTYLKPNPLAARCPHAINTCFDISSNHVEALDLIVDDVLARTGLAKVYLLGLATGTGTIGRYLAQDLSHQDKVAGAIFLSATFRSAPAEGPRPTWPLGVSNRADLLASVTQSVPTCNQGDGCVKTGCPSPDQDCCQPGDPQCVELSGCPGQVEPAIKDAIWSAVRARVPEGPGRLWGPQPDGLMPYPIVSRWGFTQAVASAITVPSLIIHGENATVDSIFKGNDLYANLGSAKKLFVRIQCASLSLYWETSSSGAGPNAIAAKLIRDFVWGGVVFASPGSDRGTFEVSGNDWLTRHADPPDESEPPVETEE